MDYSKLNAAIKTLSQQFYDATSRCENCGKEGEVYDCPECREDKELFASALLDVLNTMDLDPDKRFFLAMYATDPVNPLESRITDR